MPKSSEETQGKRSTSPAVRTNGTANGAGVDLGGYGSALAIFVTGTITDGTHACTLEESDTSGGTYTAIPVGRLTFGSLPSFTSANSNTQVEVGFTCVKQFVRTVITTSGATTGGLLAAVIVSTDLSAGLYGR